MKFSKASALGLMAFATLISLMAMSQESGGYFGANIGRAQADIDEAVASEMIEQEIRIRKQAK